MPLIQKIGDYEFVMTQSPYGLTVDYGGSEVLRYFPKNNSYSASLPNGAVGPLERELSPGIHVFEGVTLDDGGLQLRAAGLCNVTVEVL